MSPRPTPASGALILATVISAAGLNYAVIGLNRSESSPVGAVEGAAAADAAQVALTAANEVTPVALASAPVLAVAVETAGAAGQPEAASSSGDRSSAPIPIASGASDGAEAGDPDDRSSDHDDVEDHHDDHHSSTAPNSLPSVTAPPSSTTVTDSTESSGTTAAPTAAVPTTTSTEYLDYEFEGIAEIVVALHDGRALELWSVSPEPGWVFLVEDRGPREVKIKFRPAEGGEEAEFEVALEHGRLEVKREH